MSRGETARLVVDVPRLAGPTTRLRPWRAGDAPVLVAAWRDPAIRDRLKVPEPSDEAAALRWISQRAQAVAEGCSVDLAVTDRRSGEVIGEVGLGRLDAGRRAALVGWWIAEGWRGRRRATEAVRLLLDWLLSDGPLDAVMAEIEPDNLASASVARRAGMRRVDSSRLAGGRDADAAVREADASALVFARTRGDAGSAC